MTSHGPHPIEIVRRDDDTDPNTFTESVAAEDYMVWRYQPGVEIQPFECTVE